MKARYINENAFKGIPWSGNDPTKARPIGRLVTKPLKFGRYDFPSETYEVVEIVDDGEIYIVNSWYKDGRVPQLIHRELVDEYVPYE